MSSFANYIYTKANELNLHTKYLGLIRSLLAFSSLIFLINPDSILFHSGLGVSSIPFCSDSFLSSVNILCIFSNHLLIAEIVCVLILLAVISGYYPKITGILHWWVSLSINMGFVTVDGGAQVVSVLTFLLIPLTLTDNRRNHWNQSIESNNAYANITAYLGFQVIRFQVAYIYFDAAVSKLNLKPWADGTALYYFFNDYMIGASGLRKDLLNLIFDSPFLLVVSTYSVLLVEFLLVFSIFVSSRKIKIIIFKVGVWFHIFIFLVIGIFSFALAMICALMLMNLDVLKKINYSNEKEKVFV